MEDNFVKTYDQPVVMLKDILAFYNYAPIKEVKEDDRPNR